MNFHFTTCLSCPYPPGGETRETIETGGTTDPRRSDEPERRVCETTGPSLDRPSDRTPSLCGPKKGATHAGVIDARLARVVDCAPTSSELPFPKEALLRISFERGELAPMASKKRQLAPFDCHHARSGDEPALSDLGPDVLGL
jgi:hypothetical protein